MRRRSGAAATWKRRSRDYTHHDIDIRDREAIESLFAEYGTDIKLIVHTAAQPSHDWAAKDPHTDFSVNANGTLVCWRRRGKYCPDAVFIFTSTNKVYGDNPNHLPLVELETRWEIDPSHPFAEHGIDEIMSVDQTKHSLFGVSKLAADVMVQEYGRYFGMKTGCFRGGCLTGPGHSGTMLHGFLSYLVKCAITGHAVHGLRLQGQAGPRQHPLPRPGQHVLAVLPGARGPARSTTPAAAATATAR